MGIDPDRLNHILQTKCAGTRDSLWIDFTDNSPAPFRLNGFTPINLSGEEMPMAVVHKKRRLLRRRRRKIDDHDDDDDDDDIGL